MDEGGGKGHSTDEEGQNATDPNTNDDTGSASASRHLDLRLR